MTHAIKQHICVTASSYCSLYCFFSDQILTGRSSGTVIPPPLVRGGQQVSSKHGSQIIMPPLVRGTQVSHGEIQYYNHAKIKKEENDVFFLNVIFIVVFKCCLCQGNDSVRCTISWLLSTLGQSAGKELTLKLKTYGLPFSLCVCLCLGAFDAPPLSSTTFVCDVPPCHPSHCPG